MGKAPNNLLHIQGTARPLTNAQPLDVSVVDGNGDHVTSFGGIGGTNSSFGAAFPTPGTAAGFKDSTGVNMAPGNLDAAGNLRVSGVGATAAGTATLSNISASASSVTLLSANAARLGATILNDSAALLYVKFGTTASASSHTVQLVTGAYYEVPANYTGRIDGIWASATGSARVTEMSA
jgi:hypothetical protein